MIRELLIMVLLCGCTLESPLTRQMRESDSLCRCKYGDFFGTYMNGTGIKYCIDDSNTSDIRPFPYYNFDSSRCKESEK